MLFHQARKGDWTLDVPKMARTLTASKTLTKNAVDRLHELGLFRKVYGGKFALQFTDGYDF